MLERRLAQTAAAFAVAGEKLSAGGFYSSAAVALAEPIPTGGAVSVGLRNHRELAETLSAQVGSAFDGITAAVICRAAHELSVVNLNFVSAVTAAFPDDITVFAFVCRS